MDAQVSSNGCQSFIKWVSKFHQMGVEVSSNGCQSFIKWIQKFHQIDPKVSSNGSEVHLEILIRHIDCMSLSTVMQYDLPFAYVNTENPTKIISLHQERITDC